MPKKPSVREVPARAVGRGAVIWHSGQEEVVRNVSVILHMANGIDIPMSAGDAVEVLEEQPDPIASNQQAEVGE